MSPHLTTAHLEQFRNKQATPKELVNMDRHLADCAACRGRLASMDMSQSFLARLTEREKDEIHLSYEQIEAYTQSLIDDIDREIVTSHIEVCSECAERVQNLQTFAATLAAPPRIVPAAPVSPVSLRSRIAALFRVPSFKFGVIGTVATALVIGFLVQKHNVILLQNSASGAQASLLGGLPDTYQSLISSTANAPAGELPGVLNEVIAGSGSAAPIIAPSGRVVRERRPFFHWQAVPDADSYHVVIQHDSDIVATVLIPGTEWTINSDLQRGAVYSWSVTPFRGGQPLPASLSAVSARFGVISEQDEMLLAGVLARYSTSHLIIAVAYLNAGLIDDAKRELKLSDQTSGASAISSKLAMRIAAIEQRVP